MYLASPAADMLASSCACCGKALVDADSVETGVGPVCREKHGYGTMQGPADWDAAMAALGSVVPADVVAGWACDAHRAANALVYRVAVEQRGANVHAYVAAIAALGYATMAARILRRIDPRGRYAAEVGDDDAPRGPAIRISTGVDGLLVLASPYDPAAVEALRKVPGRRWDGAANTFPAESLALLVWALRNGYPGHSAQMVDGSIVTLAPIQPGETPPAAPKPIARITITRQGDLLAVTAPYSPAATEAFRAIKGRRWNGVANTFPAKAITQVSLALAAHYPGAAITWPAGTFAPAGERMAAKGDDLAGMFGIELDAAFA